MNTKPQEFLRNEINDIAFEVWICDNDQHYKYQNLMETNILVENGYANTPYTFIGSMCLMSEMKAY